MPAKDALEEIANKKQVFVFLERISTQAALVAGFSFTGLAAVLSRSTLPYWRGMFFAISATLSLSLSLEISVLFFYLQFSLVKEDDLPHYLVEFVAFNWIHLAGLFFLACTVIFLGWIFLSRPTVWIVTTIVVLTILDAIVLLVRMSNKAERMRGDP